MQHVAGRHIVREKRLDISLTTPRVLFSIGELLVTKDSAVDLRALSETERTYLETTLSDLVACIVATNKVFRAEQFSQLILVAATRAARTVEKNKCGETTTTYTKPNNVYEVTDALGVPSESACPAGLRQSNDEGHEVRMSILERVIKDARPLIRGLIAKQLEKIKGKRQEPNIVRLLSVEATEAYNFCVSNNTSTRPRISVEEFQTALMGVTQEVFGGRLVLDEGPELHSWTHTFTTPGSSRAPQQSASVGIEVIWADTHEKLPIHEADGNTSSTCQTASKDSVDGFMGEASGSARLESPDCSGDVVLTGRGKRLTL
jgi:hypothetical protein